MAAPEMFANGVVRPDGATEKGQSSFAEAATPVVGTNAATPRPQRKKLPKPNYTKIHEKPLPVDVHPLPAFIPQSPLSLFRIAYVVLKQFLSPPSSHVACPYIGFLSEESRSVHITNPAHIRALWEMGFFGKGTLSRSEPSWLEREKARLLSGGAGSGTSEEATRKRREERRLFKLERARAEREQIEQQLKQEKGLLDVSSIPASDSEADRDSLDTSASSEMELNLAHVFPWEQQQPEDKHRSQVEDVRAAEDANRDLRTQTEGSTITLVNPDEHTNGVVVAKSSKDSIAGMTADDETVSQPDSLVNQEHLQLTIEEAFFLTYGLGVLDIRNSEQSKSISTPDLFNICRRHSYFPPVSITQLRPDDPFLLNYAVYHYYRSLGWVVRPGVKFSVDYLLYNRGPVFSHAEFAIMIIPEYSSEVPESEKRGTKDWWWLHCVNRVQSQVRKSLVVCYVEVPKSLPDQGSEVDIGAIFRQYKVREFVVRRWLANRSRD